MSKRWPLWLAVVILLLQMGSFVGASYFLLACGFGGGGFCDGFLFFKIIFFILAFINIVNSIVEIRKLRQDGKKFYKNVVLLLILSFATVTLGYIVYTLPNPNTEKETQYTFQTSGWIKWKTVKNDFVITIPSDWRVQQMDSDDKSLVMFYRPHPTDPAISTYPAIEISIPGFLIQSNGGVGEEIAMTKEILKTLIKNPTPADLEGAKIIP